MATDISIISNAFILLGKQAINALDPKNPIHTAAKNLYETLLPDLLSSAPWRQAVKNITLNKVNETPNNNERWSFIYELPNDPKMLSLYKVYPTMDYQIYNNYLYCNLNDVKVDYVYRVTEDKFPPYFVNLITYALTYHLAMPVTQNSTLVQFWGNQYKIKKLSAQAMNANQIPSQVVSYNPIYEAHFV